MRSLQSGDALTELLQTLKARQLELAEQYNHYVPLVLKVAPDLTAEDVNLSLHNYLILKLMVLL